MGRKRSVAILAAAALWLSATAVPSCADSWELPGTETYASTDGRARMIVTPRDLESQFAYFEDMQEKTPRPGQREPGHAAARARVERWHGGRWHRVWDRAIPNGVAPVQAIVRGDARYAATFDDWHGTGYGPNAIVVYGPGGRIVRRLALADILPDYYVDALPHSVSSIEWRQKPRFSDDGTAIMLPIVIPEPGYVLDTRTVDLAIRLSDGTPAFTDTSAWGRARTAACRSATRGWPHRPNRRRRSWPPCAGHGSTIRVDGTTICGRRSRDGSTTGALRRLRCCASRMRPIMRCPRNGCGSG